MGKYVTATWYTSSEGGLKISIDPPIQLEILHNNSIILNPDGRITESIFAIGGIDWAWDMHGFHSIILNTINSPGGSTPSQYALPPDAKELQDLIEYREMNFSVGNIFKACYRLGHKDGVSSTYDMRKIIYFAQRELKRLSKIED